MNGLNLLGIAVGLAMDAFAVSIAAGLSIGQVTPRHVFRIAFHFGFFQFMMPWLGWVAGSAVERYIGAYDHWAAFGLLTLIGGKMLWDARREPHEDHGRVDPTRGWTLVVLSIATSIDALAVGLSMALMRVSVLWPCVVIGLVAGAFSAVGITLAGRVLGRCGRIAEIIGGILLILIGARIVGSHQA